MCTLAGRRRLLAAGTLLGLACALAAGVLASRPGRATGQPTSGEEHFYTEAAMPAQDAVIFGASPREAPGETWAIGRAGQTSPPAYVILRYTDAAGWTREGAPLGPGGAPLDGFAPASSVLTGQSAPDGAAVLAGFLGKSEVLLVREPGGRFQQTASQPLPEGEEGPLHEGEALFNSHVPLVAALEEGSRAGALAVPAEAGLIKKDEPAVLHYEAASGKWQREPVRLPPEAEPSGFQPVALGGTTPENAWLLARVTAGSEGVSLFRRVAGEEGAATWQPVSPAPGKPAGEQLSIAGEALKDQADAQGQVLTVTEQGVWVDGRLPGNETATLLFKPPTGSEGEGEVLGSWCAETERCSHALSEELPSGPYRSYAWAGESPQEPFGTRLVTGFADGTILKISGQHGSAEQLPTIGDPGSPFEIGGTYGAAFANPLEGWLGNAELPVRASTQEAKDSLEYWPTPFHYPLLAAAAEPGEPVASESSEAIVVGERGEVARYIPPNKPQRPSEEAEEGHWQPESLFLIPGSSGRAESTQLRAVAWPSANRAYAVGDRGEQAGEGVVGEMWLWRRETGFWEPDPAKPLNLRASLLGIAFSPSPQPGQNLRGYVVGQEGTLLRYGKTWTQERFCAEGESGDCLPAELSGASFTSVTFAGSEALVAYRLPHLKEGNLSYTGGVLANDGSGWSIDSEIASALPAGYVPWAVAGLPDGGAALSAAVPGGLQEPLILERQEAGAAWTPTPQPYPGFHAPASLALFREGGALRVVGSGAIPETIEADDITPAPAGLPPVLPGVYPLGLATGIIRQTPSGWSDQEHERKILRAPDGGYLHWDIPYDPDPTAAILLNEQGSEGWAIGGYQTKSPGADTADIARYPGVQARREAPHYTLGVREGAAKEHTAVFALGGGAQCAAPCSTLTNARIGPDVWLEHALAEAKQTEGLRDFLYTGPRVTTGEAVHPYLRIPYQQEFDSYRTLLSAGSGGGNTRVVASASDREAGSECAFDSTMSEFLTPEEPGEGNGAESCASGQSAYYAYSSKGSEGSPTVRVIVVDDSGEVGEAQRVWLEEKLRLAQRREEPALVVGSADLPEEDAAHNDPSAEALTSAIVAGHAAAYLFYAKEENIRTKLQAAAGAIEAFGTGTLGYINDRSAERAEFIGASGFLLIEVGRFDESELGGAHYTPVNARLIPDIEELAIDAQKGTILHRSEVARFTALARRPRAGGVASGASTENESASFVPLTECVGGRCAESIEPEYRFTSSDPSKGQFVKPDLQAGPEEVKLEDEKPVEDERSLSTPGNYGLFCAYNPGKIKVTVKAGGLTAALDVTILNGSVRRPCGTVPTTQEPKPASTVTVPTPVTSNTPTSSPTLLPPVPPAPATAPAPRPAPKARPVTPPPFLLAPQNFALTVAILPPPLPPAAEPTPPSGTSAVSAQAVEKEEEEEEAPESVSAQATAYRQTEHQPSPVYLLGLIVIAAFAGASIRGRMRRGERGVRVAPATISTMRTQRRISREDLRRRR